MSTYNIIKFDTVESTNSYAMKNIASLKHADVISAESQTAGRGRFDRIWTDCSGEDIFLSVVLKPDNIDNFPFTNVTQYLSVITARVLRRDYSIDADIKWPNDILCKGKKVSGILAEAVTSEGKISALIVGIGINVNSENFEKNNLPTACSLKTIAGLTVDKNILIESLLDEFFRDYEKFAIEGFESIMEEYSSLCKFNNEKVKVSGSFRNGEYDFVGIGKDGTLKVADVHGNIITILSGDIQC